MPSIVGPKRFQRPHKRLKTNPETPLNVAARPAADARPRDEPKREPPDPRTMDARLQASRETVYAWAMGGRAERSFLAFLAANRCPLDDWIIVVELVRAWAECLFLAVAAMPEAKRVPCLPGCLGTAENGGECGNLRIYGHGRCPECEAVEDDREGYWAPRTEAEARAAGLSIKRR